MEAKQPFKSTALVLLTLFICISAVQAQHVATKTSYEGYWAGTLTNVEREESTIVLTLKIENGQAKRIFYDEDEEDFVESEFEKEISLLLGNNLSYVWMNQGGVWSETQSHSLSFLNPKRLWCVMVRQVTNAKEDEDVPDINEEWNVVYKGGLDFHRSLLALREAYLD